MLSIEWWILEELFGLCLRKAVHRAVTRNNSCVFRVMPRFESPTCRAAQSPRACLQKSGCLELEWSTWQHCPTWIFPVKIRITVKQAWKSNMKLKFLGMFIGPTQVLRKTLMSQPGFYYPTVHRTKTFNKLKFSLCKWASKRSQSLL